MDRYTEQILTKKPDMKQKLLIIGAVLITAMGVAFICFVHFSAGVAIATVGGFLIYWTRLCSNSEYEYLFINGDLDIARITNKSTRKDIYSFKDGDVQRVLPYNSDAFSNELQVNAELTVKNFTSGDLDNQDSWYVFMTNAKNGTHGVVLELNEKSLAHVKECFKNKMN
ncbi:MAG: hypothetical protein E7258_06620 [Lachnospiraceae bacterium]|nr:hypothetical protein [Lachnospiraceae bacterium]